MKRMIAILLAALMLAGAVGCAGAAKPGIVGNWTYEADFKSIVEKSAGEEALEAYKEAGIEDYLKTLNVKIMMNFAADGKVTAGLDEKTLGDAASKVLSKMLEVLPEVTAKQMGMTLDELKAFLKEQGLSLDDMLAGFKEEMDPEKVKEAIKEGTFKGNYRLDGDKLYLWDEGEKESAEKYMVVEISGNQMTVKELHGVFDDDEEIMSLKELLPMVFKK